MRKVRKIPKLEYWANYYAKKYWGRRINHPIVWNTRIKNSWGNVTYKAKDMEILRIEISPSTYLNLTGEFHDTLKHELCHYFLLSKKIEHNDFTDVFVDELRRVGCSLPSRFVHYEIYCGICKSHLYNAKTLQWKRFKKVRSTVCNCEEVKATRKPIYEEME